MRPTATRRRFAGLLAALGLGGITRLSPDDAAAKKKKPRKQNAVAAPGREVVTRTFSNPTSITIPIFSAADPYASVIEVSGLANGTIIDVNVRLNGFNHEYPADVDILLAATHLPNRNALIMSDVGGSLPAVDVNLVLDDQAASPLPELTQLVSGTFQPTNYYSAAFDTFPGPAPQPTGNTALSTFNSQNPNGTWQLFVVDDTPLKGGSIAGGWTLEITAEVDVAVAAKQRKKRKKKGQRRR
jgi:hypothetical protein